MIILIVHNAGNSRFPSGEESVVDNEFSALRSLGLEVYKHVIYNDVILNSFAKKVVSAANVFWSNPSYKLMCDLIEQYKPDIVHFHSVLPLLTVSVFYACRDKGVPVVQTLHNYRWFCVEGGMYRNNILCQDCIDGSAVSGIIHRCSQNSVCISGLLTLNNEINTRYNKFQYVIDKFIAVSSFVRDKYIDAGFPSDKIVVKYNGINIPNDEDVVHEGREGLLFVGRLGEAKGVEILKYLIQNLADIRIRIVGDGPELLPLKQFCAEKDIRNVELLGKKNHADVWKIMKQARCVVVPSLFPETFGLVAAEAMACRTPVVASKIGALTEIIAESKGGILVDPKDAQGFLSAIKYICASDDGASTMAMKGRNYVKEHFSQDNSTGRLLEIYNSVLTGK